MTPDGGREIRNDSEYIHTYGCSEEPHKASDGLY